jgi:hypothetical protein
MTLKGHANTVTGLRVSPDGTHLLSNAMVRAAPLRFSPPAPPVLQAGCAGARVHPVRLCSAASGLCALCRACSTGVAQSFATLLGPALANTGRARV